MERVPTITDESGNDQTYDTVKMYQVPMDDIFSEHLDKIKPSITKREVEGVKILESGEVVIDDKKKVNVTPNRTTQIAEHETPASAGKAPKRQRKL